MSSERDWPARRAFRVVSNSVVREEVDAELRFHLEGRIEELMRAGMSRTDAEREARRRFGDADRIGAELQSIDADTRRRQSVHDMWSAVVRDARLAFRGLVTRPGYTAIIVLTLGLAIGANTAVYSAVRSVLLRPLPVKDLDRVVALRVDMPKLQLLDTELSAGDVLDLRERRDLFAGLAGVTATNMTLTGRNEPHRIAIARTMGDFAAVFGVRPMHGTFYDPPASEPGNHRVVVLSHSTWRNLFGADASIVGNSVILNDSSYRVVGVMPREFRYPRVADAWTPFPLSPAALSPQRRMTLNMTGIARLRDGITHEQLRGQLRDELKSWSERFPGRMYHDESTYRIRIVPFVEFISGQLKPVLLVLLGAVVAVLMIACANVGSLQLMRTTGRAREVAIRAALGAGRWPIVRQFLVESIVLASVGGVLGIVLGSMTLRWLSRWDSTRFASLQNVQLDGPVLLFATGVTLLSALIFGVVPAWRSAQVSAQEALRGGRGASSGGGRHRFLQTAVVLQLALTVVLLLGSGVMLRSLSALLSSDPGFRTSEALTMQIAPASTRYKRDQRPDLYDRILGRLRALPGVDGVALTSTVPFSDMLLDSSPFDVPGAQALPHGQSRHATAIAVTPDYFKTIGVSVLKGRTFNDGDRAGASAVVIVDQQLATQYFAGEDPVGRVIHHFGPDLTIVGVVRSINHHELGAPHKATIYYPYAQMPFSAAGIVLRTRLAPGAMLPAVRNAIREIDPDLPVYDARMLSERVDDSLGARKLAAGVLGAFAALALSLALLGTYGVLSYSISQRTRELGIRMALGARPSDVVGMVLRRGIMLATAGLLAGLTVYFGVGGRMLQAVLHGVSPSDPATLVTGLAVLSLAALVACWIPARRASTVDPAITLRAE